MPRCVSSKLLNVFQRKNASQWLIRCGALRDQFAQTSVKHGASAATLLISLVSLVIHKGEAEETRVWLDLALRCRYISETEATELDQTYDGILGQLVRIIDRPDQWTIKRTSKRGLLDEQD